MPEVTAEASAGVTVEVSAGASGATASTSDKPCIEEKVVDLNALLSAQMGQLSLVWQGELGLAYRRQADSVQQTGQIITAVAAGELLRSDDPMQIAGLNAGVRTPTTIDHPAAVVRP